MLSDLRRFCIDFRWIFAAQRTSIERMNVKSGDQIIVRDALGQDLPRRATSAADPGDEFTVVWACREEEWEAALAEHREPESVPWPIEEVHVLDHAPV